ncbi:phage tail sheath family protein [Streptomyces chartreusis]|uniref:phage tail sheath family protein n=1 Tax=Streptomyces chartreusis TaxID=1969 RepID=UPI0033E94C4B
MPSYLTPGVYMEEVSSGSKPIEAAGTATAAFVGFTEKGPVNESVLISNWTQYTNVFGDFMPGAFLPQAVYGYFLNGGGNAYIVSLGPGVPQEPEDRTDSLSVAAGKAELPAAGGGNRPALRVALLETAPSGSVSVEVKAAAEGADADAFTLVVLKDGEIAETYENVTTKRGPSHVGTAVKQKSAFILVEETKGGQALVPAKGGRAVLAPAQPATPSSRLSPDDYVGDAAARTGFAGLEAIEDVTMLAVPDLMSAHQRGAIDAEGVKAVQMAMIAHCELMADRVAILDAPPGLNAQQFREWRQDFAGYDSKYAALYWPWAKVMDPQEGKAVFVPPSGHIAGVWARNDDTRGVHKAPANEVLRGVLALELAVTKGEQAVLNPMGVNCLRTFPGQGIRIWGARTLSSDPEWRYLNVRRLFNFVEKSILDGTNWVVFEPNDHRLWDSVRRTITMFLTRVWRSGALFGRTPEEAFFVRCNEENNPPENRDAGILTIDIGIAPVKPAEFVVFRLSQFAQGAALDE